MEYKFITTGRFHFECSLECSSFSEAVLKGMNKWEAVFKKDFNTEGKDIKIKVIWRRRICLLEFFPD